MEINKIEIMIYFLLYEEKIVKFNVTTFMFKATISSEWEFMGIWDVPVLT